ncbi:hypothetical protein BTJ40_10975 [Microbulbifer sp. A4B17]|nr:hypothetical protein BTJ40_10975 [Microbulbifer sp. A4B17]
MGYVKPMLPFLLGWGLLLLSSEFREISLLNGIAQLVLFTFVVCVPAWKTERMSYVDIGWPMGLAVIGVLTLMYTDGYWLRKAIVSAVYLFVGLRMGIAAISLWKNGHLNREFPRYEYQRLRWKRSGRKNIPMLIQVEVLVQGLANASFLAFPAFIIGMNPVQSISPLEIAGLMIWLAAFAVESVADIQKSAFLKKMRQEGKKNMVCNVGLWRYSRHPNYFAEWMVWNGLVIASIPSWIALYDTMGQVTIWLLLGGGLLFASRIMYTTLVYYTGAVPAEYYSVKKRPDYKTYQSQTNRFFPGPVKRL